MFSSYTHSLVFILLCLLCEGDAFFTPATLPVHPREWSQRIDEHWKLRPTTDQVWKGLWTRYVKVLGEDFPGNMKPLGPLIKYTSHTEPPTDGSLVHGGMPSIRSFTITPEVKTKHANTYFFGDERGTVEKIFGESGREEYDQAWADEPSSQEQKKLLLLRAVPGHLGDWSIMNYLDPEESILLCELFIQCKEKYRVSLVPQYMKDEGRDVHRLCSIGLIREDNTGVPHSLQPASHGLSPDDNAQMQILEPTRSEMTTPCASPATSFPRDGGKSLAWSIDTSARMVSQPIDQPFGLVGTRYSVTRHLDLSESDVAWENCKMANVLEDEAIFSLPDGLTFVATKE